METEYIKGQADSPPPGVKKESIEISASTQCQTNHTKQGLVCQGIPEKILVLPLKLSFLRREKLATGSDTDMDAKRKEMDLLSNSIAAYAHIKQNPESFGLYFVIGVCFGLVLTLCLLVIRISCKPRADVPASVLEKKCLKDFSEDEGDDEESEDEDEEDEGDIEAPVPLPTTEIPVGNRQNHSESDGTLSVNVFTSAEELERAQRLEERERIIREIWRNGQPDILGSGTGTLGRVHYY
ncbi:hypothetical protein DPEC_G00350220 [Dallia pectoralis]|uniref:Uncharacterized protein n=1 Tax=Dallia pectoralis TaxID=75939 RepID=A0ACC2F1N2_DALPE|nr:hypothetical protein DPEC_G00350220 [Dallia pectoralis]